MTFDKTNTGTLGRNKNRRGENHPEFSGQINVGGVDYWLSGWLKQNGGTGEKFFSLSVRQKNNSAKNNKKAVEPTGGNTASEAPFDDDIPL